MNGFGFVQKRRGVLDHLQDGRLTLAEYGAYDAMILLADKASGIWTGSARALAAICGAGDISERKARHILESLERKGYVRRFPIPRSHRNYPVLVNRYKVSTGAQSGKSLNAAATTDWRFPVYDECPQPGAQVGAQPGAETAPIQERERDKRRKATPPAPAKQPSPVGASLASLLKQRILENNPEERITDDQARKWGLVADLMMRRDNRTEQRVREVIEWSQRDSFWKTNIRSMKKLREQFGQLTGKMRAGRGGFNGGTTGAGGYGPRAGGGKVPLAAHSQRYEIPLKPPIVGPSTTAENGGQNANPPN